MGSENQYCLQYVSTPPVKQHIVGKLKIANAGQGQCVFHCMVNQFSSVIKPQQITVFNRVEGKLFCFLLLFSLYRKFYCFIFVYFFSPQNFFNPSHEYIINIKTSAKEEPHLEQNCIFTFQIFNILLWFVALLFGT